MKRYIILLALLVLISSVGATSVTTISASVIDSDSVTFNGLYSDVSGAGVKVWFEYGMGSDFYMYATPKTTITTNQTYSYTHNGYPLLAGKTFYYRAMAADTTGNISSFQVSALTAISDYNFDAHIDEVKDSDFNVSKLATATPKPYEDIIGSMFWGVFFSLIFISIWLRQDDVTIPALLGIIISAGIFALVPTDYLKIGYALLIVSIGGLIISIVFKK